MFISENKAKYNLNITKKNLCVDGACYLAYQGMTASQKNNARAASQLQPKPVKVKEKTIQKSRSTVKVPAKVLNNGIQKQKQSTPKLYVFKKK